MITTQPLEKNSVIQQQPDMFAIAARVLSHQPLAILAEDMNRKVRIVNKAFCTLFQISIEPQELVGMDCVKLTLKAQKLVTHEASFIEQINGLLQLQKPVNNLEFELKDGRHLSVEYTPCLEAGLLLGNIWCYTDISDRVKANHQLDEQKRFSEIILNSIPADIAIFNKYHQYIFINEAAVKNAKLRSWLISKDDFDYCNIKNKSNESAVLRREKFNQMLAHKKEVEWEDETMSENGEKDYVLRRFHPNFDTDGNISFVTGYGININQLKKKENELMLSEYKHRKLLAKINEVVFWLTLSRKIEILNPAWTKILGYTTEDCIGRFLEEFVSPLDFKKMANAIDEVIIGKTSSINTIVRFTTKQGTIKWLKVSMSKTEKLVHLALWGTLTDITEQQIAEQETQKALKKEKELNELKSSFVNMVSHEFRTPMAGILSSVELLELIDTKYDGPVKSQSAYYYGRIKSQVARMTELMNNVLLLGRIEAGRIEFKPTDILLSSLSKETIEQSFYHLESHSRINMVIKGKERKMYLDSSL